MADIEITDEASLEAWLKTRPRRDAEIIAFRAAARVFPLWGRAMEEEWAVEIDLTALHLLRMHLTVFSGGDQASIARQFIRLENVSTLASIATAKEVKRTYFTRSNDDEAACLAIESLAQLDSMRAFNAARQYVGGFFDDPRDEQEATERNIYIDVVEVGPSFWKSLSADANRLQVKRFEYTNPLWHNPAPEWFTQADRETRAIWAKDPATWAFWEKWWDGVISGDMPFAPDLLRDVALIEDDIWQAGPKAVAEAIARIEAAHRTQPMNEITADQALDRALAKLPPAKDTAIAAVREAVIAHRADLLENFDALQGFIDLEIKRLQELNYMSDEHRDVCVQQIRTLSVIGLTVERLSALVPKQAGVAPDAAKIESLGRVYINLFEEWPRSNAREVVDTTWRVSFVGIGAALAYGLGFSAKDVSTVLAAAFLGTPLVKVAVESVKSRGK